jgi:hypothetical protein
MWLEATYSLDKHFATVCHKIWQPALPHRLVAYHIIRCDWPRDLYTCSCRPDGRFTCLFVIFHTRCHPPSALIFSERIFFVVVQFLSFFTLMKHIAEVFTLLRRCTAHVGSYRSFGPKFKSWTAQEARREQIDAFWCIGRWVVSRERNGVRDYLLKYIINT